MSSKEKQESRRVEIIINYFSLVMLTFIFYYGKTHEFGYALISGGILCLTIAYLTFDRLYMKSGLWKLSHSKIEKLDERELQLTHNALRLSYSIFTIFILSFVLIIGLVSKGSFNMFFDIDAVIATMPINFFVLWYIANTLPPSIIAWKEKTV